LADVANFHYAAKSNDGLRGSVHSRPATGSICGDRRTPLSIAVEACRVVLKRLTGYRAIAKGPINRSVHLTKSRFVQRSLDQVMM
jgi:hypothetical protein